MDEDLGDSDEDMPPLMDSEDDDDDRYMLHVVHWSTCSSSWQWERRVLVAVLGKVLAGVQRTWAATVFALQTTLQE